MPVTNCDVIQYADVTGYWGKIIVSDGGFGPFLAQSIFSALKHGVTSVVPFNDGSIHTCNIFDITIIVTMSESHV